MELARCPVAVENFDSATVGDDANVLREAGVVVNGGGRVLVPMVLMENVAVVVVGIQECYIQMVAKEEEDAKAQVMEAVGDVTAADLVMKVRAGMGEAVSYVDRQGAAVILLRRVREVGVYSGLMTLVVVVMNSGSGLMREAANCNVLRRMVGVEAVSDNRVGLMMEVEVVVACVGRWGIVVGAVA